MSNKIDSVIQGYVETLEISGGAMIIRKCGQIVYKNKWGWADLSTQTPIGDNSIFRMMSMTKPVTAVGILNLMENAGRDIEDEILREQMKSSGLGTPATRAAVIERLIQVGYARRSGKHLVSTEKGRKLIAVVPEQISSAVTTGKWEKALSAMAGFEDEALRGAKSARFLDGINKFLLELAKDQIRLAFEQAEKEVEDLRQRTREGIVTARLNGKQIGARPGEKRTTKKSVKIKGIIEKHSSDFNGNLSDVEIMQMTGVAKNTYYKYKKELKEQKDMKMKMDLAW